MEKKKLKKNHRNKINKNFVVIRKRSYHKIYKMRKLPKINLKYLTVYKIKQNNY